MSVAKLEIGSTHGVLAVGVQIPISASEFSGVWTITDIEVSFGLVDALVYVTIASGEESHMVPADHLIKFITAANAPSGSDS